MSCWSFLINYWQQTFWSICNGDWTALIQHMTDSGEMERFIPPTENIPWQGRISPLASSWVLSVGLAERNRDRCFICARSSRRFSPVLLGDSPSQRWAVLREGGGEGGGVGSDLKSTTNTKFLALEMSQITPNWIHLLYLWKPQLCPYTGACITPQLTFWPPSCCPTADRSGWSSLSVPLLCQWQKLNAGCTIGLSWVYYSKGTV